jgi:small subunit ribosomal protein S8
MISDPIGDLLTRIRNVNILRKKSCIVPFSKQKERILYLIKNEGYIKKYRKYQEDNKEYIEILLKYDDENRPSIHNLKRISRPGKRIYAKYDKLPVVLNGLGVAVVSTNKGLMSDERARRSRCGGELVFKIW